MSVTVRFAPSPTGYIHVGNLRPAVLNALYARANGGTFILRLDDTDEERSTPEYAAAIKEDLAWLGLNWDRLETQSSRKARYDEMKQALIGEGLLYPCYETPEELDLKRKIALNAGRPPVYDRAALSLTDEDRTALEGEGRKPHFRFKLPAITAEWDDGILGHKAVDLTTQSDPVLIRADGTMLYTLPSVTDDLDFGVTHIIRGDDHTTNTAVQLAIFSAVAKIMGKSDDAIPGFAHHALIVGSDGEGLSKRLGSLAVRNYRDRGYEPIALLSLMARIGTSDAVELATNLDELASGFTFDKVSHSQARFDEVELDHLNARFVHEQDFAAVADQLAALGITGDQAAGFWDAVKANLTRVQQAADWWPVVAEQIAPVIADDDREFIAGAADHLPETLDEAAWGIWTKALKEATGRKGKQLFMPLRQALTAKDHGPELKNLLPLIPRDEVLRRLQG